MSERKPLTPSERTRRWNRKPADVVECPTCGLAWQRNNRQRSDGTVHHAGRCTVVSANEARRRQCEQDASERYRGLIRQTPALRLVAGQEDAMVGLMLHARREGLYHQTREQNRRASRRVA